MKRRYSIAVARSVIDVERKVMGLKEGMKEKGGREDKKRQKKRDRIK